MTREASGWPIAVSLSAIASRALSIACADSPLPARMTTESRSPASLIVIDSGSSEPGARSTSISRTGPAKRSVREGLSAIALAAGEAFSVEVSGVTNCASDATMAATGSTPAGVATLGLGGPDAGESPRPDGDAAFEAALAIFRDSPDAPEFGERPPALFEPLAQSATIVV